MGHVVLAIADRYLRLSTADGELRVRGDGGSIESVAVFDRVVLAHGRIALRTLDGEYLALRPDRCLNFGLYPEDDLTPRAAFEEILWPDGKVSLRSCELTFVSATPGGASTVVANRMQAGPCERFDVVAVSVPLVPRQRSGPDEAARPRVQGLPRQGGVPSSEERLRARVEPSGLRSRA